MPVRVLIDTPAIFVESYDEARVVTMVRSRVELPRARPGLRAFYEDLLHAFDGLDRARYALIVDGRASVGRNDDVFEAVQAEYAERLFGGYRKVLALVSSTVGRMQVARYNASRDRGPAEVFSDLAEAFAHVAIQDSAESS
ncbi:MAG: hypothetical protein KUG77_08115 [Nannocystaceae bacterium]|nr:hypothetical protein [Nannocystaceae bacterium]